MGHRTAKLTALAISKLQKPGIYGDGAGLWLQVSKFGTRAWLFRFMQNGRARKMGLGPYPDVSLAEARQKAFGCRAQLRDDIDPIEARNARRAALRAETARQMTFRECAEKYIAAHAAGWKSAMHLAQWFSSLENFVYPLLGGLSIDKIETAHVLKVLEPIWITKPETAARVRGRIESILDWARARGFRSEENPARWKGHLKNLLPARRKVAAVKHLAALPYAEVPSFMRQLRALQGTDARALEFAILTASRSGEILGAKWSEIDVPARMWVVPAARMKGGREHRIPLSERSIEILETLPREGEFVLIGRKAAKPLPRDVLQRTLGRIGRDDITVHGFRSAFRDWASEQTAYPSELCEMALAHAVSNKVEAAYRRGDLLEKRRRLMADWAEFCSSLKRGGDNVRNIRGAAQ